MAALNLAKAYSKGEFGDPDYVKAEEWYRRAANNGLQEAEYELGKFLRRIDQYDRALDILKRSAAIGYAPSMRTVGTMHAKGEGVPRDLHQARRWWERSIAGGNVFAKRELAFAMIRGEYGWIDRPLGALLFLSALADAAYIGWTSAGRRDVRFT
jgi:TPR repeat protein